MTLTREASSAARYLLRTLPVLAMALLGGLSCGQSSRQAPDLAAGTPVILISVDTLRADRLPAYGYGGIETPTLDTLRRDSILFARAYSHVPLTLPSHAALLTGLLPPENGVRDNQGYDLHTESLPFLPRILQDAGYVSGGAVSAYVLHATTGIGEGWDFYDDHIEVMEHASLGRLQRSGNDTLAAALPWLRTVADKPFFLFLHLYEPHSPYEPPEPFASRYADPYDGEVATADAIVGRLLDELRELGLYERSLVIFLSDHGEGLGDHGQPEHEVLVYNELLHVPLMLKLPHSERGGETIERPVQLVDIVPSVLNLLGLPTPIGLPGSSLLEEPDAEEPPRSIYSETLYPRLHFGWSDLRSLIRGRWHYIQGPDPELYDLLNDPAELENLLREQRPVYGELKHELEQFNLEYQAPSTVDPETREKLAALGYLGSIARDTGGHLPDPKSRLQVLRPLGAGMQALYEGDFDKAATVLQRTVELEPELIDAWEHLGKALQQLGRYDEALAALTRAMELSDGAPQTALAMADLLLEMGRPEEAREYAEIATTVYETGWDFLTEIALREGDLEAAEGYLEESLAHQGNRIQPLVLATRVALERNRTEEAAEFTRRAETMADGNEQWQLRGLYFAWGKAYALAGELEQAKHSFLQEIEINPDFLGPYTHLAYVYALENDGRAAGAVLKRMVETNPKPAAYAAAVETLRAMGDERSAESLLHQARRQWPDDRQLRDLQGS